MLLRLKTRTSHALDEQAPYIIHRHEATHTHKHTHTHTQTFAALRSVVDIPSWAIATLGGSRRVGACAFAVAAAVVCLALVHVYVHRFV